MFKIFYLTNAMINILILITSNILFTERYKYRLNTMQLMLRKPKNKDRRAKVELIRRRSGTTKSKKRFSRR